MTAKTTSLDAPRSVAGSLLSTTSRLLAVGAIEFYRAHLSPLKGYKCAHGVMGGRTCSTEGLQLFQTVSLREAFARTQAYMRECRTMSDIFYMAVANERPQATAMISGKYGKSREEAEALVLKAEEYADKHGGKEKFKRHASNRGSRRDGLWGCDPMPYYCALGDCDGPGRMDGPGCDIGSCDGPGGCD